MLAKRWIGAVVLLMVFAGFAGASAQTRTVIPMVFSTNEDYDTSEYATAQGLKEVEKDFQLVKELGLDRLRVSFSWANYEPLKGRFANLDWLHQFVDLADEYGITLIPYLCYAPGWATTNGQWYDPPVDYEDWYDFVFTMVSEFKDQIHSWELWNEQDHYMWWSGSLDEFAELIRVGSQAVKDADSDATIIMGGLTGPDTGFLEAMFEAGLEDRFHIMPVHSYHESWSSAAVESYIKPWGTDFDYMAEVLAEQGRGQPIWLNEIGYPTIGEQTEYDQASFIRRAVGTLIATEKISLISWYEIKDLPQDFHLGVIGDSNNYHLGLTTVDRTPKLGFYTYQNIVSLLNHENLILWGDDITFVGHEPGSQKQRIYLHGFERESDGHLILFAWLYGPKKETIVDVTLPEGVQSITEYALDGTPSVYSDFQENQVLNLHLVQDGPRLFEIVLDR